MPSPVWELKIYGVFWPLSALLLIVIAILTPTAKTGRTSKTDEEVGKRFCSRQTSADDDQEARRIYIEKGCAAPKLGCGQPDSPSASIYWCGPS